MPIPFIPVIVAGGAIIVTGVSAGARGAYLHVKADRDWKAVVAAHKEEYERLEDARVRVDQTILDYGTRQLEVQEQTIGRFVTWLESHQKLVKRLDGSVVDGIEINVPELTKIKTDLQQITKGAAGLVGAGAAGATAQAAALWGVGSLASASTGTAISSLSGIAAQNATLAWLGGGSLAAGGAGIAGGTIVLGFIIAAPAAVIAGATLAWSGARRRRRTEVSIAEARTEMASMRAARALTGRIGKRVNELRDVLTSVNVRAEDALSVLEKLEFNPDEHGPQLLRVVTLVRALREILNVPVIDKDGELTDESIQVVMRYK